ncbi:hypothetical protein [Armatimonas rosea]|uniref:PH domain-containing protein n=1 Tax=Armatimonas rosea TaxID=685828 RepID=A0A7W9W5U8_ARMRO|nr:hypothetical protein [Armatimonas rosea]MBB6049305.1 hypothetical protein [Armatimonas rosea]
MRKQTDTQKQTERASQVFYTAPATVARVLCLLLFLLMAAVYASMFFLMPATEALALLPPLFPLFAWGILGEVALAFLVSRLSPIHIDSSGITLTTVWGAKQILRWDEIQSATPGKCLFVSYLKVSPSPESRRTPLIIPMTVTRPSAFADSIRHHAPQGNPVQRFLDSK